MTQLASTSKNDKLYGILTAIFSPINRQSELQLDLFAPLLEFQKNAGVNGLVICGTNGEGTSLTVAERKLALDTVLGSSHVNGMTIVAGTGAASVNDAIELTQHAAKVGADAVLVLPPFFFKGPSAQGLADYFRKVMDSADLPVLLYNIPKFTAVPITNEVLDLLADHPNLAGVKDSAGVLPRTLEMISRYSDLKIFSGSDSIAADCLIGGGAGCVSGGANAFPELVVAVLNGFVRDSEAGARQAQERLNELIEITSRYPFISNGKAIIANRGLPRLGVLPPLTLMPEDTEHHLISELTDHAFL